MEDRWGDILYLIFMVLLLVAGAIKKNKSRKTVSTVPNEGPVRTEDEKASGFETVLETLLGEDVIRTMKEEEKPRQIPTLEEIETEVYDFEKEEEIETFIPVKPVQGEVKKKILMEIEEEEGFLSEEIDWRKAIIYSEILNRKYN